VANSRLRFIFNRKQFVKYKRRLIDELTLEVFIKNRNEIKTWDLDYQFYYI
jgi:hypothetical protein